MRAVDRAARVVEEGERLRRVLDQHGLAGVAGYLHCSKGMARTVLLDVDRLKRLIGALSSDLRIRGEAP